MKVLVVEDCKHQRNLLMCYLKEARYDVYEASNPQDALDMAEKIRPKIILLDIELNDNEMSGYDICEILKYDTEKYGKNRVIMLTSKVKQEDVNKGFKTGTNDYIKKPFDKTELLMRVKNLADFFAKEDFLQYKNIKIDTVNSLVTEDGKEVTLSKLEYKLLLYFVENVSFLLSREKICIEVWEKELDEGRMVDLAIAKLRKKIESLDIKTIHGFGYKLVK